MKTMIALLGLLAMAAAGCNEARSQPPTPAKKAAAERCQRLIKQLEKVRGRGGACKADRDCTCHPGITDCGGVTDKRTAKRIVSIVGRYYRGNCPTYRRCALKRCVVSCRAGACRGD